MIKKIIRKIPILKYIKMQYKLMDFNKDKRFFKKNYMYSKPVTKEKIEYDMLLEIHKLEKGFAVTKNLRPFGSEKIKKIISDIELYRKMNFEKGFAYNLACSALEEYLKFYKANNWDKYEEYKVVNLFMKNNLEYLYIPVGAFDYKKEDFLDIINNTDYDNFISCRRSIRNFSPKKLDENDIKKAISMAIKTPTACNRQMCKIYFAKSQNAKNTVEKYAQGLGLFDLTNANYFILTFDISANYFVGERNQGWFNSGLVTLNFINSLHSLGIGSCCIQFGNNFKDELEFKKILNIPKSERIAVIITAGYYDEISRIPFSSRKNIKDIYEER